MKTKRMIVSVLLVFVLLFTMTPLTAMAAPGDVVSITVQSVDDSKGTVSGGGDVAAGDYVTITATPNPGYVFSYWTNRYGEVIAGAGATYTFAATETMQYTAWFESAVDHLDTPTLTNISNVFGGIKFTWTAVEGADHYVLLFADEIAGTGGVMRDHITGTSYTVPKTQLPSGKTYIYFVQAVCGDVYSDYSNVMEYTYIEGQGPDAPTLTSTSNVSGGIKVTWTAVEGADYYVLLFADKAAGTGGVVQEHITGTSFTVPKAQLKSGTKYTYFVQAVCGDTYSEYSNEKDQTYLAAPTVTKTRNVNAGIEVTWDAVAGADSYIVMYKKDGGSWSTLESGVTATKYVAPKAKLASGTKYWFTVKAKGAATSGYTSGKAQTYMTTPAVTKTRNVNAGIEVTWDKVTGATSYILMYKTDGGSWATYKSGITATKFVVPKADLKSGTKYWFTVKAKGAATSGYSSGKAQTYMTTPTVKSAAKVSDGVKVTWGAVTGAKTYTVMMKVSGGSWTTVKSGVTGTSYTVPKSKLTSGKTYSFTVKAVGAATSGYSSGKSLTYKA